jgi:Flp pilus assembly protein TadD
MPKSDLLTPRYFFWALIFLGFMSAVPFLPALSDRFVWDDHEFIVNNPAIKHILPIGHFFKSQGLVAKGAIYPVTGTRPVTSLSLAIDYAVWKLNPFGYHLTNLILHVLCVLGVFLLARSVTGNIAAAFFGAGFFAVLPGHAEAVIALFGRADLLATFFVMAGFLCYTQYANRKIKSIFIYLASVIMYLFACFSKEMGLVLLGLIAVYEVFVAKNGLGHRKLTRLTPFIVIGILYWLYRGHALGGNAAGSHWWGGGPAKNFLMMFEVYTRYLRVLFIPAVLNPLHLVKIPSGFFDWPVLAGFAVWAGSLVLTAIALARRPIPGFFGSWFLIALIPVANIIPIPGLYMAEKWLYLPSVGLCGLAGWLLARLLKKKAGTAALIFGLVGIIFSIRTFYWNRTWHDDGTLSRAIIATSPDSYMGRDMFGKSLLDQGKYSEAEQEFRKAIVLKPGYYLSHSNLAMALNYQGRYPEAEAEYRLTIRLNPDYAQARSNLGVVLWLTDRTEEAIGELRQAVRMDSANPMFHYNLASILKKAGNLSEALAEYRRTADLEPDPVDALVNIGIILGMTGRPAEAETLFRQLRGRHPEVPEIRFNLARILDAQGKSEEAIGEYRAFLATNPERGIGTQVEERIRQLEKGP